MLLVAASEVTLGKTLLVATDSLLSSQMLLLAELPTDFGAYIEAIQTLHMRDSVWLLVLLRCLEAVMQSLPALLGMPVVGGMPQVPAVYLPLFASLRTFLDWPSFAAYIPPSTKVALRDHFEIAVELPGGL